MPRVTPSQELDHLAQLVGTTADGVSIDALSRQLGGGLHRRTLQRRLALLVAQGPMLLQHQPVAAAVPRLVTRCNRVWLPHAAGWRQNVRPRPCTKQQCLLLAQ